MFQNCTTVDFVIYAPCYNSVCAFKVNKVLIN